MKPSFILGLFLFMLAITVGYSIAHPQAEAPPIKDECQWMYDKAYDAALQMDKDGGIRRYDGGYGNGETTHYASDVSIMWSQLYVACKAKVRR